MCGMEVKDDGEVVGMGGGAGSWFSGMQGDWHGITFSVTEGQCHMTKKCPVLDLIYSSSVYPGELLSASVAETVHGKPRPDKHARMVTTRYST